MICLHVECPQLALMLQLEFLPLALPLDGFPLVVDGFGFPVAVKDELSKPQAPTLADFLNAYYAARNAVAWSHNARIGNLLS